MKRLLFALSIAALSFSATAHDIPSSCFGKQASTDFYNYMETKLAIQTFAILDNSPGSYDTMTCDTGVNGCYRSDHGKYGNYGIKCYVRVRWAGSDSDGNIQYGTFEEHHLPTGEIVMSFG